MVETPDFDAVYRKDSDPWQVGSSFYEQRKLEILLASLASPSYDLAWDPACGTGELALRLAGRCSRVVANDGSAVATGIARERCAIQPNVVVSTLRMPSDLRTDDPADKADLVVLSEWLYYLDAKDRTQMLNLLTGAAQTRAEVVAIHWRHRAEDAWLSGEQVQAEIVKRLSESGWRHALHHDDEDFVMDGLRR